MTQLFKLETNQEPAALINQARQILNAEYLKRCTDEYKTWSTNNPYAKHRTGELLLRFPPFTGVSNPIGFVATIKPPSEKDVVNKALELFNLNTSKVTPTVDSIVKQDIEPELTLNQPLPPIQEPVEEIPIPAPKNTEYVNKVFDIFKVIDKLATTEPVPTPEPTPPEIVPLPIPPVEVITEPIPEPIPEPTPEPKVIPQTDKPYVDKIEEIFKDVPKQPTEESFTSILRKTFFGAKANK